MTYRIPCTWTVCGVMEVEADSLENAIIKAKDEPLPQESDYIDDSFSVNREMLDYYNENGITV